MPQIDLVDETWIRASLADVATEVARPLNWHRWWPQLDLVVEALRGPLGVRWWVRPTPVHGRTLTGSMEIWLEPAADGVVLHYFLRLDPVAGSLSPRRARRIERERARASKVSFFGLKDDLEAARR
jgi:hypothetical protein